MSVRTFLFPFYGHKCIMFNETLKSQFRENVTLHRVLCFYYVPILTCRLDFYGWLRLNQMMQLTVLSPHTHQNITGLCWLKSETCYKIHTSRPSPSGIKHVTVPTISIHQETWCSILNRPATHVFSISLLKIYCYLLLCIKMLRFRMECENNTGYMKEYDSRWKRDRI